MCKDDTANNSPLPTPPEKPKCRRDADLMGRGKRTQEPLLAQSSLFGQTRGAFPRGNRSWRENTGRQEHGERIKHATKFLGGFFFWCFLAGQVAKENPFCVQFGLRQEVKARHKGTKTQCLKWDTRSKWQQTIARSLIRTSTPQLKCKYNLKRMI